MPGGRAVHRTERRLVTAAAAFVTGTVVRKSVLSGDRIGLVVFAGQAFTQAPLTFDYTVVRSLIGELDVGMIEL